MACRLIIISILHRVMDNNIFTDQRPRPGGNGHPPSIEEAKIEVLRQKFPDVHPSVTRASMAETPTRASDEESTLKHALPRVYTKDRYYFSKNTLNTTIEYDNNGARTVKEFSLKYKVGKKPEDDKTMGYVPCPSEKGHDRFAWEEAMQRSNHSTSVKNLMAEYDEKRWFRKNGEVMCDCASMDDPTGGHTVTHGDKQVSWNNFQGIEQSLVNGQGRYAVDIAFRLRKEIYQSFINHRSTPTPTATEVSSKCAHNISSHSYS